MLLLALEGKAAFFKPDVNHGLFQDSTYRWVKVNSHMN